MYCTDRERLKEKVRAVVGTIIAREEDIETEESGGREVVRTRMEKGGAPSDQRARREGKTLAVGIVKGRGNETVDGN